MARPTPVLPEVGSTIVPPGRSAPDASAASTIRSAMRSLTDPPGLKYSTLASTSARRRRGQLAGHLAQPDQRGVPHQLAQRVMYLHAPTTCTCPWWHDAIPPGASRMPGAALAGGECGREPAALNKLLSGNEAGRRHARGSHRRHRPLADRPGVQGLADQHPPGRPGRPDRDGGAGQGAAARSRPRSTT